MQPIEINVRVTVGMEAALLGIISKLTENTGGAPTAAQCPKPRRQAVVKPLPVTGVESEEKPQEGQEKPLAEEKPQAEADTPDTPDMPDTPQPAKEEKPAQPAKEEKPVQPAKEEKPVQKKEYTEVDVRAAMHKVRQRIEGENYKEQPDSEGYKRWHKVLTGWFKNTAAVCGAEKPSALPDSDSRSMFIQCCENVRVENDELVEDCPF